MRTEDLDRLIEKHPDCIFAAYADIDTGVTLLTNSGDAFPREALDELCIEAALSLGMPDAPPIGMNTCNTAIKADDSTLFIYLRAQDEPADALICICQNTIAVDSFLEEARLCLADEGQDGA